MKIRLVDKHSNATYLGVAGREPVSEMMRLAACVSPHSRANGQSEWYIDDEAHHAVGALPTFVGIPVNIEADDGTVRRVN